MKNEWTVVCNGTSPARKCAAICKYIGTADARSICMPAIDPRLFWERDFSINERFNYECGQPANRGSHIHAFEAIDRPLMIPQNLQFDPANARCCSTFLDLSVHTSCPRRPVNYLKTLKSSLLFHRTRKSQRHHRERWIAFGRKRASPGAGPAVDFSFVRAILVHAAAASRSLSRALPMSVDRAVMIVPELISAVELESLRFCRH